MKASSMNLLLLVSLAGAEALVNNGGEAPSMNQPIVFSKVCVHKGKHFPLPDIFMSQPLYIWLPFYCSDQDPFHPSPAPSFADP